MRSRACGARHRSRRASHRAAVRADERRRELQAIVRGCRAQRRGSAGRRTSAGPQLRLAARASASVDPESLDAYRANGGYAALRRAFELGPAGVIREVIAVETLGTRRRGLSRRGARWKRSRKRPARPHYLVCNADESEPGTFKDRVLMEDDPFAIVEAMTIAAFAAGCEHGYIYIRGEYPLAHARACRTRSTQRARRGLLGDDVMGRGLRFDIEIRRGAGAYICGEETALFNSIEGKRGEPRNKPPFPVHAGLFGKPTLVNNVETLANLPLDLLEGGDAYARIGHRRSTGTRLFCLSGAIVQPGRLRSSARHDARRR